MAKRRSNNEGCGSAFIGLIIISIVYGVIQFIATNANTIFRVILVVIGILALGFSIVMTVRLLRRKSVHRKTAIAENKVSEEEIYKKSELQTSDVISSPEDGDFVLEDEGLSDDVLNADLVPEQQWKDRIQRLVHINQYLLPILRWHSVHINSKPVDRFNYTQISSEDVVQCIQQMNSIGMLDDKYRILNGYKLQLMAIFEFLRDELFERGIELHSRPIQYCYTWFDRFEVVYAPGETAVIQQVIRLNPYAPMHPEGEKVLSKIGRLTQEIKDRKYSQSLGKVRNTNYFESLDQVQYMSGVDFEQWCMKLLWLNGYSDVCGTKVSGDGGIDIFARREGKLYAIQCKRYKQNVGYRAVQEIFTGASLSNADQAVVMTNSDFTGDARKNAAKLGVLLWNGYYLTKMYENAIKMPEMTSDKPVVQKEKVKQVIPVQSEDNIRSLKEENKVDEIDSTPVFYEFTCRNRSTGQSFTRKYGGKDLKEVIETARMYHGRADVLKVVDCQTNETVWQKKVAS